jgi:competence protein ComEC
VYQAGHHGSSSSSTAAFVDAVDPQVAIISSNRDSQYGHPHDEVLATFANRGIETYWTGVHGTVVVTTDGDDIDVTTAETFPPDPDEMFDAKEEPSSLAPPASPVQPGTDVARATTAD